MRSLNPRNRTTPAGAIAVALYRIGQAIDRLWRKRAEAEQLSPAQMQTLLFLRHGRPAARTIGGLAQQLAATYATTSGVVDALERKGLAERRLLDEDRRVVGLALTASGERQAEALEDLLDDIEDAIAALSEADQEAMLRATQAIVRRLQASGHVHVYEMCWGCQFFRRDAHPEDPRGPHHCAFVDGPLAEPDTYFECPDFVACGTDEATIQRLASTKTRGKTRIKRR